MTSGKNQAAKPPGRNPILEAVLDQLAAGVPMEEVKQRFNLSQRDIIQAAMYGVAELREEYLRLLVDKHLKSK